MSPMTYSGASCSNAASRKLTSTRGVCSRITASTRSVCCATEKISAPLVWPFQRATRARPWAMSAISISSGEGSIRSSRRPDSMRCHARAALDMRLAAERRAFGMAVAIDEMIVDHAGRLHEGVDDGRPDEIAAAFAQVLGDRGGNIGLGDNVAHGSAFVLDRLAVDKAP